MCGASEWVWGGTRCRCFNSGYHDPGLLQVAIAVFDCTCNTQNSLLLNQHNWDDATQAIQKYYSSGSNLWSSTIPKWPVEPLVNNKIVNLMCG